MEKKDQRKNLFITTDKEKGALKSLADEVGYGKLCSSR